MSKVLILTASYGDGHNAAARSLRDAIRVVSPETEVEVLDLFETAYPRLNLLMKRGYQGLVRYAPAVWSAVYSTFDNPKLFRRQINSLAKLRHTLAETLREKKPNVVISTYPVYGYLIERIFRDHGERSFRSVTVVTDSTSVCAAWFLAPSDLFIVADETTANVLLRGGVPPARVQALGFPVSPAFARERPEPMQAPGPGRPPKVLYAINTGKARAGKSLERLLEVCDLELTITAGRNEALRKKLARCLGKYGGRARVYGWTDKMPQLLMSHHLLIGKAGGATVQETIAAGCPMIINQVIPGQEEGNARLIESLGAGVVAEDQRQVPELVASAFADGSRQWREWRDNLAKASRPDSALRIAEEVLELCGNGLVQPLMDANKH
jgi:UDP-N-acetylglucosamine:LPS N-acetylglucosamine transferase